MNAGQIVSKNRELREQLFSPYDPITGVGSPIERIPIRWDSNRKVLLPKIMVDNIPILSQIETTTVKEYAATNKQSAKELENAITRMRLEWDFEFWAATCVKIQDKQTKRNIPFILRQPQRKLFQALFNDFFADKPVRVILLKARQWGGSTLVQIFMAWVQIFVERSWHSVIVADVEDQSRVIRSMYSRMAKYHPREVFAIEFSSFENSTKNKLMKGRDCVTYLSSMQKPDGIRSADVAMAHLTEIGLWRQTNGKKPEDVIQSISGTIPDAPHTVVVYESTAKGVGNFFHREWQKASGNDNGFTPVFVAWFEIEMYQTPFASDKERDEFIASMSDKEAGYFELGATLEGINWYRTKKNRDGLDDWRMECEFPSTPQEAFQSTGARAHDPRIVYKMRSFTRTPKYRGDMFADAWFGKKAIDSSMHFTATSGGNFWVWELPDTSVKMKNRYVVSVDIGGRTHGADFSVISVIDRYYLSQGGVEECIGTYRTHLDQDLLVWKALQIAKFYCNALLVVESNSLNQKGEQGDHSLTILDEIIDYYDNIYSRSDPQKIREGAPVRYGFHTNSATKTDLITQMNKRLREQSYIERDVRALDEADYYECKANGTYGAVDGEHDDIYMSRAIGLKASSLMDMPALIEPKSRPAIHRPKVLTESSF